VAKTQKRALQDYFDHNCWGCGPKNRRGLHVKSFWSEELNGLLCKWAPKPNHASGPNMLNGGVIFTLMDCHSIMAAVACAYKNEGREFGTEPHIWFVTKEAKLTFSKPTPLDTVELQAIVQHMEGRIAHVSCTLYNQGIKRAEMALEAIRVPAHWRE